jgi:hypothetical protein
MSFVERSSAKPAALVLTLSLLAWGLEKGAAESQSARPKPPAKAAAAALCNLSAPPNLAAISNAIAPGGRQFTGDYNVLSEAGWCTLIALSWAAQGTAPTMTPDATRRFGTGRPVVWETWLSSTDIYCANGNPPGSCGGAALKAAANGAPVHRLNGANPNTSHLPSEAVMKLLQSHGRAPQLLAAGRSDQSLSENAQATGFILPDRNNNNPPGSSNANVIMYEVRENPSFVTFLSQPSLQLYNRNGQTSFYNAFKRPMPPGQSNVDFPGSAFEVKPSWYIVPASQQPPPGMFLATGQCDPGAPCGSTGTVTIGLTGFHILWKVFPRSTWYWLTFEYNASAQYNNANLTPILNRQVTYNNPNGGPQVTDGPYNPGVVQPPTVASGAQRANAIYRPMLAGTAFANYQLVGAQVAFTVNGVPTLLANTHIETDFGAVNTIAQNPSSSCITCHYYASIGPLNTKPCPSKPANIRRINIFKGFATGANNKSYGYGYTGNGDPAQYTSNGGNGPFVSSDFVWSIQLAQWKTGTTGCPTTAAPAAKKSPARKPVGK